MGSLVLTVMVIGAVTLYVRQSRRRRQRWLRRLDLPGVWVSQDDVQETLLLQGGLAEGGFESSVAGAGQWRLSGDTLVLRSAEGEERRFELTLYDVGKMGLEEHGRRTYYMKNAPSNVVPLNRRG